MNGFKKSAISIAILIAVTAGGAGFAAGPDTATPEEAMTKVREAVKFLHDKGASGYAEFNNAEGKWVWKDSYVFVYDCRLDKMVAHPLRPDLVGKSILQIQDNNGKYIFKELCKAGDQPHGGWVEYVWPKPGAGNLSRKVSYAHVADISFASGIQVSAGVYDDKVTLPELNKALERVTDPSKYPAL
ncbi:MAG: cache domain-containing protein [Betaproteobacteria bacterium]|nr:cache domain-containing protein [Betaproteobacteria bacterium]